MLPSPATERTQRKNIPLDLQLTSCEAQRDLVFARVREPLNQRNHRRGSQNRHFETPQAGAGPAKPPDDGARADHTASGPTGSHRSTTGIPGG